jgi:hypothetical protein
MRCSGSPATHVAQRVKYDSHDPDFVRNLFSCPINWLKSGLLSLDFSLSCKKITSGVFAVRVLRTKFDNFIEKSVCAEQYSSNFPSRLDPPRINFDILGKLKSHSPRHPADPSLRISYTLANFAASLRLRGLFCITLDYALASPVRDPNTLSARNP